MLLLFVFALAGCAHNSTIPVTSRILTAQPELEQARQGALVPAISAVESPGPFETREALELSAEEAIQEEEEDEFDDEEGAGLEEGEAKQAAAIADPLEKFNRAMFTFNDRLYYWVLKPVAQAYADVVPEAPRVSVNNFFTNLGFPVRFVSMLLQADFSGAVAELGRFTALLDGIAADFPWLRWMNASDAARELARYQNVSVSARRSGNVITVRTLRAGGDYVYFRTRIEPGRRIARLAGCRLVNIYRESGDYIFKTSSPECRVILR